MSSLKVYALRDTKAGIYHPPFYNHSHGEAERNFHQLVKDPKSTVHQYPEDFDLYHLGTYDDITGKICPTDSPVHMLKATAFNNN